MELKEKRTQNFVLSVVLLLADVSEERKNASGGDDLWFIALNVAPKTRKTQQCVKCGASLAGPPAWGRERGRREKGGKQEQDCFGLPHGGAIVGLIIGIIIIIVGLSQVPGLISPEVREVTDPLFWPAIIIIFGILIVAGAIYGYSRRS